MGSLPIWVVIFLMVESQLATATRACKTMKQCMRSGGRCSDIALCEGEVFTGSRYCRKKAGCGCCVPPTTPKTSTPKDFNAGPAGMLWHYHICPELGRHSGSLEMCKNKCLQNDACTAFNFVPGGSNRCELLKCPVPVPEPTWNYGSGWLGYSLFSISHEVIFSGDKGNRAMATDSYGGWLTPNLAFDRVNDGQSNSWRFWHSGQPTLPKSLWYEFREKVQVVGFSFRSRTHKNHLVAEDGPSKYTFWASNEKDCSKGRKRHKLFEDNSGTPFPLDNSPKMASFQNHNSYRCYGFEVTHVPGRSNGDKWVTISDVHFYTPTARERDQLEIIEKYAPKLRFDSKFGEEDKCFPSSAEYYYKQRASGNTNKICNTDYNTIVKNEVPTYWRAMECGNNLHIAYWFFSGYQDTCSPGIGDHDADWEHVVVKVMDYKTSPKLGPVQFYQHHGWYTMNPGHYEVDDTHPVVYSGKNSHGSYHDEGGYGGCCYWADYRKPGSKDMHMKTWLNLEELSRTSSTSSFMHDTSSKDKFDDIPSPLDREENNDYLCKLPGCYGFENICVTTSGCFRGDINNATFF